MNYACLLVLKYTVWLKLLQIFYIYFILTKSEALKSHDIATEKSNISGVLKMIITIIQLRTLRIFGQAKCAYSELIADGHLWSGATGRRACCQA